MTSRRLDGVPAAGDVLLIGQAASVQFTGSNAMTFRVIRVQDGTTYDGWAWLDGYRLDSAGNAVERRSIFVQLAGLLAAPATHSDNPSTATNEDRRKRRAVPGAPSA
jgi:hypothetical protein